MKNKFYFDSMIKQSENNMHALLKKESMQSVQEAQLSKTKCLCNRWKMFQIESNPFECEVQRSILMRRVSVSTV